MNSKSRTYAIMVSSFVMALQLSSVARAQVCGDGDLEIGEQCDNGASNSDSVPDSCRTDCRTPWCGDTVIDTGVHSYPTTPSSLTWHAEACDEGHLNSDFLPDTCREDCTLPYCGDGIVDSGIGYGELCDEGPDNSDLLGATCSRRCIIPGCGNGVLETWEMCDDGNTSDADACTSQCRYNVCGDGHVWASVEMCEYELPWDRGECRYDCGQNVSICGNGTVDLGEGCDEGGDRNNDEPGNPCRTDCQPQRCGDGIVDDDEACDLHEGCAPDCTWIAPR